MAYSQSLLQMVGNYKRLGLLPTLRCLMLVPSAFWLGWLDFSRRTIYPNDADWFRGKMLCSDTPRPQTGVFTCRCYLGRGCGGQVKRVCQTNVYATSYTMISSFLLGLKFLQALRAIKGLGPSKGGVGAGYHRVAWVGGAHRHSKSWTIDICTIPL